MTQSPNPIHQPEALSDSEYVLALIDETFASVPQVKAHHDRMRKIAAALATQPPAAPAQVGTSGASAEVARLTEEDAPIDKRWYIDRSPLSATEVLPPLLTDEEIAGTVACGKGRGVVGACRAIEAEVRRRILATPSSPAAKVGTEDADAQETSDYARIGLLEWAVERWRSSVQNRPMINIHRRTMDDCWRSVMRYAGGDPDALVGPSHDALVSGGALNGR